MRPHVAWAATTIAAFLLSTATVAGSETAPSDKGYEPEHLVVDEAAWHDCQTLLGYQQLRKSFDIDRADIGNFHLMPKSLLVDLRVIGNAEVINTVHWLNPLTDDGVPRYSWRDFLKVYQAANHVLSRHQWLKEWRDASQGRVVELWAFGVELGESEFDTTTFVTPLWKQAAFAGEPEITVLARRGDTSWARLYFGSKDSRALLTAVEDPAPESAHWLDRYHVYFHPHCVRGESSERFVVIQPTGDRTVFTYGACEP